MYSEEIEKFYQNYLHYNKDLATVVSSEEDAKKKYIKSRLKNEDLLGLVSKYIKKRGFREAVDVYIEKRTPIVSIKKDGIYLEINETPNPLAKSDLSAQLELIKCDRFLNIYTTNYDNLIEVANELTEHSVFEKEPIITSERLSNQVSKKTLLKYMEVLIKRKIHLVSMEIIIFATSLHKKITIPILVSTKHSLI